MATEETRETADSGIAGNYRFHVPSERGDGDGSIRLCWNGKERIPLALLKWEVLLALDRPDRMEMAFLNRRPFFAAAAEGVLEESLPRPETPLRLQTASEGTLLFEGEVERLTCREIPGQQTEACLVAYSRYHFLRDEASGKEYHEDTLDEVAVAIALELGLEAVVDRQEEPLSAVKRQGDPLRFLRTLARPFGLALAVTGGRLYLKKSYERIGSTFRLTPGRAGAVFGVSVEHRRRGTRRVVISGIDATPIRPLDRILLQGFGAERDGAYRAARCRIRCDPTGLRSDLGLVDDGPAVRSLAIRDWRGFDL